MERDSRHREEIYISICSGTKWDSLQSYKKCPRIMKHLWGLLKVVWRKGKISSCWQQADGCFTPKEEKSENITQFRTISLLNVEGKIFFSVLARRMTSYMTGNSYVDTSAQKCGVPGFSGHTLIEESLKHYHIPKHFRA